MRTLYEVYALADEFEDLMRENGHAEMAIELSNGVRGSSTGGEALTNIGGICRKVIKAGERAGFKKEEIVMAEEIFSEVLKFTHGSIEFN